MVRRDDACAIGDLSPQIGERFAWIELNSESAQVDPAQLRLIGPGKAQRRVLLIGDDHLVAGPPVDAGGDQVRAVGGIARQSNFRLTGTDLRR